MAQFIPFQKTPKRVEKKPNLVRGAVTGAYIPARSEAARRKGGFAFGSSVPDYFERQVAAKKSAKEAEDAVAASEAEKAKKGRYTMRYSGEGTLSY